MSLPTSNAKEIEDIIGSIKQNFECPICLELMLNPVSTKCDHKFCRHCISEVISRKPSAPCPLCKASVTKRSLQDLIEWKNFVEKVKQLVDAFKLDLAEGHVVRESEERAKQTGVPIPSPDKPSVFYVEQGAMSTTHDVKRRRSVRFKLDREELNNRQDEDAEVEQIGNGTGCNNDSVRCLESIEIQLLTNKTSSVTSDAPHRPVSKKTDCLRNEFSEAGVENNASTKCSATDVDSSSSSGEEDDDSRGLIIGGYQAEVDFEVDFDVETRPAAENHKIFKSRALSKEVKPAEQKSKGDHSTDDPYAFVGSQPTPKRKKYVQRQLRDVDGIHMFEDFNVLPKRRKRASLGETSVLRLPSVKKNVTEVNEPTGDEYCNEIQALSDKLLDAESYNLVLSQQFKISHVENKKSKNHMDHSSPTKTRVSGCTKILPLTSKENREQMQKTGSTLMQKDSEEQAVRLTACKTVQNSMVPNKMARNEKSPNHTAPKKVVPKMAAPNSSVPKVNEVEPNETVPSKIPNKSVPTETLSKEAFTQELVPNKLMPNDSAPKKTVPKVTAPNSSVLKVNEIEPNETIPSNIPNKSVPAETLPKEAFTKEVVPNKLMPSKTVPDEVLSKEMVPNETAPNKAAPKPNTDRSIGACLGITGTSPNIDVSFQVDSGSNSGVSKVCDTDNYSHSSARTGVEGNAVCMLEQDGDVSAVYPCRSSKRRKCSELIKETSDDNLDLSSRDLPKTRSSSRRRSQFQTVETKWQKKYQRNVAAKEERRKAIEEFDRLQDVPTSNRCTASTSDAGLNQDKSFMDTKSITLTENSQAQCLEEEAVGEVEERPTGEESAGGVGNETTKEENKIYRLEEQSTTAAVQSSSQSSISCVPDSVENQVEENQGIEKISETVEGKSLTNMPGEVPEMINETCEYKSVKETLMSDQVFSDNRRSDVLCMENEDTPLRFDHRVAALESSRATDNVPMQENQCKNAVAVPDDVPPKPKGKRKTFSLKASFQASEKMLCVSESSLSESLRTTDSISREESQCRDSMAAPVDVLLKPKAKRKRKTFSLEASPRGGEKMNNYSLPTDSIDIEQVIGEAVLGMLGKTGSSASPDDDMSTQEIEMHEAVWKSGQTAKRNSLGCMATCVVGNSQCVPAEVKTGVILVNETESGSTEVTEEKIENELNNGVTEEVVNCVEVVARGNKELLSDNSSECDEERVECTRALVESSAKAETQADRKSECIVVGTADSSSVHSNSYSLLQPPVSVAQNKNCAVLRLKDSSVKVQDSANNLQSMCLDSCQTKDESLPDVESERFVEAKGLTGFKSDELKVDSETKSQHDLLLVNKIERGGINSEAATCSVDYLKAKMEADLGKSELQSESNLVMESVTRADPNIESDLTSVNEQNLYTESHDIRRSLENLAHQLSSTCEPAFQTEEIHAKSAEGVLQDAKNIEEPETFVNVAEENESDESDESDDEITSPVSRTNLPSSGNMSSESEMLTTQQRQDLEVEVRTMEEEIARLQAELTNDVETLTDKIDVPIVTSEISDSEQEANKPDPDLPASPGKNDDKPNNCDTFEEGIIRDNPESDEVMIIQDSSNIVISDQTAECKVDDFKTELKPCQSATEDVEESSSEADLFGSQMSDIVAIPQTPTPTKDKTPRARFSRRGMERDVERKETPRSPTPPPTLVMRKKEKKNSDDLEYVSETKRLKLSHDQDHKALSDENRLKVSKNLYLSNDESKTCLKKSLERQGNYSRKASENLKLVDEGIAVYPKTPDNRASSSSVATTGKRGKSAVYTSSAMLRECSTQPSKEKRLGSPFPQKKNWILVASGVNRVSEMPLVDEFVRKLGCRFLQKFTNGTTHVLVKPVKEGSRRCQRTLKYFQGIAHRSWVISIEWVIDSIRMGCLQPEDKYEITGDVAVNEDHFGPTNARLSGVQLLRKFEICCLGAFDDLTRDDLRGLAEACGASSLQDPAMFSFDVDRAQVIIVEGSSSDTGLQHFKKLYKKFSVPIVAKEWLLDSVGTYDVKPLDEYGVYPPLPS